MKSILLVILPILIFQSCIFGPSQSRGVMSYRHERVFLQGSGYYRVGPLNGDWRRMKSSARAISFYNKKYKASITTDAFCAKSFSDRPLDSLSGELISVLSDRQTLSTGDLMLDGRGAKRVLVDGKMDGVPVTMDMVVTKKNSCSFDFIAVAPPENMGNIKADFEEFFLGFHY